MSDALYKVHCKTFSIAQKITGSGFITVGDHPFLGFRVFPQFRTEAGKKLRSQVAKIVREERSGKKVS